VILGYDRLSLVEHVQRSMKNVESIRQVNSTYERQQTLTSSSIDTCLLSKFDEYSCSSLPLVDIADMRSIRRIFDEKLRRHTNSHDEQQTSRLMIFQASHARLYRCRTKQFDRRRYPSLEQWILVIYCHASNAIDFYFDDLQANQLMCDYLDELTLKGKYVDIVDCEIVSHEIV
jgi:hypothetical protein